METIQGYVAPLAGRDKGCCQIAIVTDDGEYHVAPRGAGVDLLEHLSVQVEVSGTITREEDQPHVIQVRTYTFTEPNDEDW